MWRRSIQQAWRAANRAVTTDPSIGIALKRGATHEHASCSGRLSPALHAHRWAAASYATSFKDALFSAQPASLASPREVEKPSDDTFMKRMLLRLGGYYSKESQLLRGARSQYISVKEQVANSEFRSAVGLGESFAETHALLCLHMWLLLVRLRNEGSAGRRQAQMTYELFTDDVEMRVRKAGIKVQLNKQLQDLEKMFYGSCAAYDRALNGEEDFRAALVRNVYGNSLEKSRDAGVLERYLRRELACLTMTDSDSVLAGNLKFSHELK